jgi:hypothetical protein
MEHSLGIIVGDLDFISEERCFRPGVRADEGVRDFVRAPAVDDLFAGRAPVIGTYEAGSPDDPSAFDVLLGMLRGMAARGEVFASAIRAFLKTDINVLVNAFRPLPEVSRMTEGSSPLFGVLRNLFHFIFIKGSLQRAYQLLPDIFFFRFKFSIPLAKFHDLSCSKIDHAFKLVNPCPEIVSFCNDLFRRLPVKIQTGFIERTIDVREFLTRRIKPPFFHDSHPELFAFMHRTQGNRHPANQPAGCSGEACPFYQKTTPMSTGMFEDFVLFQRKI